MAAVVWESHTCCAQAHACLTGNVSRVTVSQATWNKTDMHNFLMMPYAVSASAPPASQCTMCSLDVNFSDSSITDVYIGRLPNIVTTTSNIALSMWHTAVVSLLLQNQKLIQMIWECINRELNCPHTDKWSDWWADWWTTGSSAATIWISSIKLLLFFWVQHSKRH